MFSVSAKTCHFYFPTKCWIIKLGKCKLPRNTLPIRSGNPQSLKKWAKQFKCFLSNENIQLVNLFTILSFKRWVKEQCVAKVLPAIWETFLHENNCKFNSYKLSYKLAFKPFVLAKNKNRLFRSWWSVIKHFFVYSEWRPILKACWIY